MYSFYGSRFVSRIFRRDGVMVTYKILHLMLLVRFRLPHPF